MRLDNEYKTETQLVFTLNNSIQVPQFTQDDRKVLGAFAYLSRGATFHGRFHSFNSLPGRCLQPQETGKSRWKELHKPLDLKGEDRSNNSKMLICDQNRATICQEESVDFRLEHCFYFPYAFLVLFRENRPVLLDMGF